MVRMFCLPKAEADVVWFVTDSVLATGLPGIISEPNFIIKIEQFLKTKNSRTAMDETKPDRRQNFIFNMA